MTLSDTNENPLIGIIVADSDPAELLSTAVERSGGVPLPMVPAVDGGPTDALERVSGLVVAEDTHDLLSDFLLRALASHMPVLCVEKGMHALNTALGGKSARSAPEHDLTDKDGEQVSSYHRIFISPGSKLAAIVGSGGFVRVNSRHATCIGEAQKAPSLRASAYGLEDGVIEAVEIPDHPWALGIQFNPERAKELPPHFLSLFRSLVYRAKEFADNKVENQQKSG